MEYIKSSKLVLFAFLFLFLANISTVGCVQFSYVINSFGSQCVGEYLTENTVAIFAVVASSDKYKLQLLGPKNQTLYKKENEYEVKVSLTAAQNGNHMLCITSRTQDPLDINFEFLSGVAAKDYSEIAKQSNLKPIELSLHKLEDMIEHLIKEIRSIMTHEEASLAVNDSLSGKIIFFSMITLLVMIVVGIFETAYIQKFLRNRKVI